MKKYFDFAVLTAKAQGILQKTIEENFSSSTYDELPGNVRVIYSFKRKEGKNKRYTLDDLMTARVHLMLGIWLIWTNPNGILPLNHSIVSGKNKRLTIQLTKPKEPDRITQKKPFKGFIQHCREAFRS